MVIPNSKSYPKVRPDEPETLQVAWELERDNAYYHETSSVRLFLIARKGLKRRAMLEAKEIADEYWETVNSHRHGIVEPKEFNIYGVRLIEQRWTVTIQWYSQQPTRRGCKPAITAIGEPKNAYQLPPSKFPLASDWELEAITRAEDRFHLVRKMTRYLKDVNTAYNMINEIYDKKNWH